MSATLPDDFDLINEMLADASAPAERKPLPKDFLGRITTMAELLIEQEKAVADAEAKVVEAKELARRTREEDLPQLMKEAGLEDFTLADGSKVKVDDDLTCTITEANRETAFAWLAKQKLDGVIKTSVIISFGKEERKQAVKFIEGLRKKGLEPELKEGVHPQTLKSLLKEQLANGVKVPWEPFSLRPFLKASVKAPTLAAAKKARVRKAAGLL